MEDIDSKMVIFADIVAVSACLMAIFQDSTRHRRWLWYSCFTSIPLAVFWLYYMLRYLIICFDTSLGPLSGAGICLYVDHLLNESSEEVRKLRAYMYRLQSQLNVLAGFMLKEIKESSSENFNIRSLTR